ncbi:MAG: transcription antitermination factor NusB [Puniceicoccales bacterium]|jgi:N utilization substance protein B|nr:transcription antitermination factor NusB [Puniceicoccales bacterium]
MQTNASTDHPFPGDEQVSPEHIAVAIEALCPELAKGAQPPEGFEVSTVAAKSPAKGSRRACRFAAMQYLYAWDMVRPEIRIDHLRRFFESLEHPRETYAFGEELAESAIEHLDEIDEIITARAENWEFVRIAKVDLAILRLATYELFFRNDIPPIVTINEAVEMSKIFSTAEARRFVNGILDKLLASVNRPAREAFRG